MQPGTKRPVRKSSATDWDRVKREATIDVLVPFDAADAGIEHYDPNDAAAVAGYGQEATIKRGRGRPPLNRRVDAEVLPAFKATGPGWQTRINALLRAAAKRGLVQA